MNTLRYYADSARVKIREILNPYLGSFRLKRGGVNPSFTIISNNCWAGHVYRYFNVPYNSPTIGLFFYSKDYVKFVKNLKYYLSLELEFIPLEESKWEDDLRLHNNTYFPIGKLGDIEIMFLHYKTQEEAKAKWQRRAKRVNWNNLFFKMSEQNLCDYECLKEFDSLPTSRKFCFTTKDYGLESQVIFKEYLGQASVRLDTTLFRKYINLSAFLTDKPFKLRQ